MAHSILAQRLQAAFLLAAAVTLAASSGCRLLHGGCGCGLAGACGAGIGCGCEPGCALEPGCEVGCAVETGCGCEPACGCGSACGCDGRSMAGQMWCGGCGPDKPLINVCTGPSCCGGGCGCGSDVGCGMEPGCGCDVGCGDGVGCGDACGCGAPCGCCPLLGTVGYTLKCVGQGAVNVVRCVGAPLGLCCPCGSGCGGCGELYWNEWHSDPPQCCDPCDDCGNWVGPSATSMRAPYDHQFSPRRVASLPPTGEKMVR